MTTEAMTEAEAAAELLAIRRAKPIYRQPKAIARAEAAEAAAEAEARAKAGTTDSHGMAAGQIVRVGTTEATARAEAAAAARASLPKSSMELPEAKAAKLAWHKINGRDYSRAEAADFYREQREMDRAARAATAAKTKRAELGAYVAGLVLDDMTEAELTEAAAKAAKAAAKAATKAEARVLRQAPKAAEQHVTAAARAELMGLSIEDILEADPIDDLMAATGRDETLGNAPEAGAYSLLSPAELAELTRFTKTALSQPAAAAGRAALEAMGLTAQAVVSTNVFKTRGSQLVISELHTTPSLETAKARAAELAEAAAKAAARLAAAEAKAAKLAKLYARLAATEAAEATGSNTTKPLKAAEAEADRLAAAAAKLAKRLARAEAAMVAAEAAEDIPGHATGYYVLPVGRLELEAAAEAAKLPVRRAVGRMPSTYAHKGPEAKAAPKLTDNTSTLAIANVMGQTAEAEAEAEAALRASMAAKLAAMTAEAKAARETAAEATRTAARARAALALRIKRRAAKNK
jgi:hypothetical protein